MGASNEGTFTLSTSYASSTTGKLLNFKVFSLPTVPLRLTGLARQRGWSTLSVSGVGATASMSTTAGCSSSTNSVYFLINTCLTGLRSSGILSREVSVFIIIGLTARRGGEGKGKGRWRANTCVYSGT